MEGMMSETPNPADFSVNERPREYRVAVDVRGSMSMTIYADSEQDARKQVEALFADDNWIPDLDDIDDLFIRDLYKAAPMYRVVRDGQTMQVGRLLPGDIPREPNENGF
jgi:hypothetical protein